MLGQRNRDQLELFVAGSLEQLLPEDHILRRVDRVLDLGWLREAVADCYCTDYAKTYRSAEQRGVDPVVPPKAEPPPKSEVPLRRFRYDARHDIVRCPAGRILRRSTRARHGWFFRARVADCRRCPRRAECLPGRHGGRALVISDGYDALLRARRRRPRWTALEHRYYQRHRWRAEGIFAEAKDQHGLRRAVRRGRWNVAIQAYLTAAAINLKRLAASLPSRLFWAGCPGGSHIRKSPA